MACLALVLEGPKTKNGRRVFESFKEANRQCFWNRELVSASESLIYMGFMRPGTLFVSAPAVHLNTLRSSWSRRVLKPAEGYTIQSLGDLGAIQTVEQMHYVPLGDVVCDAISQLNRSGIGASVATVRSFVSQNCPHVAAPGQDMIKQTIASLCATGIIYRMGEHYFVSVPTNSPPKQKQTVECQTGQSIMVHEEEKAKKTRRGLIARLFSRGKEPSTLPPVPQPIAFSTEFPPPQWMTKSVEVPQKTQVITQTKFPSHHERLCEQAEVRKARRRRQERRQLSSSSECLNYGPIDPPECLPPGYMEAVMEDMVKSRQQRRAKSHPKRREPVRTSTPVGSDSAYSPSPVTDSNEEGLGAWSDPEDNKPLTGNIDHTYVNLLKDESTQFEEFSSNHHVSDV